MIAPPAVQIAPAEIKKILFPRRFSVREVRNHSSKYGDGSQWKQIQGNRGQESTVKGTE